MHVNSIGAILASVLVLLPAVTQADATCLPAAASTAAEDVAIVATIAARASGVESEANVGFASASSTPSQFTSALERVRSAVGRNPKRTADQCCAAEPAKVRRNVCGFV
jgi:hypothetical protein